MVEVIGVLILIGILMDVLGCFCENLEWINMVIVWNFGIGLVDCYDKVIV